MESDLSWSDLKTFVAISGVTATYSSLSSQYCIVSSLASTSFVTNLLKNGGADQTDFETNYKDTTILAQTSTNSNQKGPVEQGAVTTSSPIYVAGQLGSLSLTTAGALRVDNSGVTQPVSGTVTSNAGSGTFTVGQATGTNLHTVVDSGTTVVTQATADNLNAVVQLQDGSGNDLTSTATDTTKRALDVVLNAPSKATYSAGTGTFIIPATPTDMITMVGSATKTIKILKITLYSTQNSAGTNNYYLKRYSTVDTGGTSATITGYSLDTTSAAATATIKIWTANPTLGTLVGALDIVNIAANPTGVAYDPFVWDFTNNQGQPLTLRGATDQIAINFAGTARPNGLIVAASISWTEE